MRSRSRVAETGGVRSLERGLAILSLFSEAKPLWTISDIARSLELPLASTHRLVKTLETVGFLERPQPRGPLRLGVALLYFSGVVQAGLSIRDIARPIMQELAISSGETCVLMVPGAESAICIEHVDGTHPIRPYSLVVGEHRPYNAGAVSLALLAFLPESRQEALLDSGLPKVTSRTTTSPRQLRQRLEAIRHAGIAYSESEVIEGTAALAAPVFDADGSVVASLGITGIEQRFVTDRRGALDELVRHAASSISAALGWSRLAAATQ